MAEASGKRGVYWSNQVDKWVVHISINNRNVHLGYYDNIERASEVFEEARAEREAQRVKNRMERVRNLVGPEKRGRKPGAVIVKKVRVPRVKPEKTAAMNLRLICQILKAEGSPESIATEFDVTTVVVNKIKKTYTAA
jgi:hypothetical protein